MAEETPGTTSKGIPQRANASASSPPRPKTKGSPPLRRATAQPGQRPLHQQRVDAVLSQFLLPPRLAREHPLGGWRRVVQK